MTAAKALLVDLGRRGIALEAVGNRIRYRPPRAAPRELVEQMTLLKDELLALLKKGSGNVGNTHADAEWARFCRAAVRLPGICGWTDPTELRQGGPALARHLKKGS
ncbi:MAG TPA: hypothetical protein PKY77_01330 [Phycisphaerae bacterium]|nr:hypothetical protein [Phycisphaerae bacterium]HRY67502.1 hypothetical protein [Phycisphaerae bacterium]HSA24889.1 hypothetical protein [Phycisphaerae bacterium]